MTITRIIRFAAFSSALLALVACTGPATGDLPVTGEDAGTDANAADASPPADAYWAVRSESFPCNVVDAPTLAEPVPFEGSSEDSLLVQYADGECASSLVHRHVDAAGTTVDTVISSGSFYFGQHGIVDSSGSLLACASHVVLSPSYTLDGDMRIHQIENVRIECSTNGGGSWTTTTVVAPPWNEWAAWAGAITPGGLPGQYRIQWIRDFSLFPFTMTDRGRPIEDGVYETLVELSGSSLSVLDTTQVSTGVMGEATQTAEAPDGTEYPLNEESTWHEEAVEPSEDDY